MYVFLKFVNHVLSYFSFVQHDFIFESYSEVSNSGSLGMVFGSVVCSKLKGIYIFWGNTVYLLLFQTHTRFKGIGLTSSLISCFLQSPFSPIADHFPQ